MKEQTLLPGFCISPEGQMEYIEIAADELPNRPLLRPDEVASFFSVGRRTVYRWIDEGKLVASNPGGKALRIMRESVVALLSVNKFA